MQKILQTVNKFAIDTTKVFVLALKVICRDIILPMLISFQNCSMPAAAGLQQRCPGYSKPISTAWRESASAPTNMTGSLATGVPQNRICHLLIFTGGLWFSDWLDNSWLCLHRCLVSAAASWNSGMEVPRWGVAEIQKMSPSTTGRCK